MVYHRPSYLVRLPNTVKELLLDMQTKARQLQWSIMGSPKDVTLTLTWQCRRKTTKDTKLTKKPNGAKSKRKSPEDLNLSDWVSDNETSQAYSSFSKQLEMVQSLSKLASAMAGKPVPRKLPTETKLSHEAATSPQDIDDGYLTEKATPDEMHVYPRVVVRPPFYLPSRETLINGNEESEEVKVKLCPVPVPLPPPPPVLTDKQLSLCNKVIQGESKTIEDVEDEGYQNILETDIPEPEPPDGMRWSNSKSSIEPFTEEGNTSFDRLLNSTSDNTDNEIVSAIRFGKYVKFRELDSDIFKDDGRPYQDGDLSDCSDHGEWDELLQLRELDNSPRHKISYIDPGSVDNLNKKKKVKRKSSFKNLFAPWHRKKKFDVSQKKTPKSPKTGRKMISPKPLYSQKNYVRTSAPGNDNGYKKVIEYQRIKSGQKDGKNSTMGQGGADTWDSSLESQDLQRSVDHCLKSCDTILSRQAHAPSDL